MGRKYFLNTAKGCFLEKGSIDKNKKTFTEITGHLVSVKFKETIYGETLQLQLVDEENFYVISMFVKSRVATAFFMLVKNLDVKEPMTLLLKEHFGRNCFYIWQFGGPVLWYYTMENENELPQDVDERRKFLKQIVTDELMNSLAKKMNPFPNHNFYKPARKGLQGGYFDAYKS